MKKNLIDPTNKLVDVQRGRYLRAGSNGPATIDLNEDSKGIVVDSFVDDSGKSMLVILVKGELINMWQAVGSSEKARVASVRVG